MERIWWKEAVVYQIYPRSFMDSNGDGMGDLPGITSRADYLAELGVTVVWLSPVYKSPNADNGYDISDYQDIAEAFGTMAEWEALLEALHSRGIKLVMDLVVNHSSDEHPWFVESRASRNSPKRDWYIWRDGRTAPDGTGLPPNDWGSIFSGSAWKYDEATGQWYLHLFAEKQPDLNWECRTLREAVYAMMRFWLDKGVDGFRMDVINMISKDPGFTTFMNGPRIHEFLQEMNRASLAGRDVMTVGETPGVDPDMAALYVGPGRGELNMVFQFEHMDVDSGPHGKWDIKPWKLSDLKRILGKWQTGLDGRGWNSLYLNNHDQPRMVSRFGDDKNWRRESATLLATMLHTMQGTPYIYQGEEIGMTNVAFPSLADYDDIEIKNFVKEAMERGGETELTLLPKIHYRGRDNARTPMQWTAGPQAGFTTGKPWLAVNPNHASINVEESRADPDSIFHYYRRLIALRKENPIMAYAGAFMDHLPGDETLYVFSRRLEDEVLVTILNFSSSATAAEGPRSLAASRPGGPGAAGRKGVRLLIGNYTDSNAADEADAAQLRLRPWEARTYILG